MTLDPNQRDRDTERQRRREHRRRRLRRRGRRAFIRSVYSLPSLATLGNAICGFAAIYISALALGDKAARDPLTEFFAKFPFVSAAWLIFAAMIFDALDGRLARFTRHTTDFGGQLDSLADAVSFGVAPAFLAMQVFKSGTADLPDLPLSVTRLMWAIGALYMSCAVVRLARFNVSNEHGEQHHFSFLGLPSPGAAGTVAAFILVQQDLARHARTLDSVTLWRLSNSFLWLLPVIVLVTGLLMVSAIRYPHIVNRYLRGRRSIGRVLGVLASLLLIIVAWEYALAGGLLAYCLWGIAGWLTTRWRRQGAPAPSA